MSDHTALIARVRGAQNGDFELTPDQWRDAAIQLADALEAAEAALTASRERERRLREALEKWRREPYGCRDGILHDAIAAADGETGGGT